MACILDGSKELINPEKRHSMGGVDGTAMAVQLLNFVRVGNKTRVLKSIRVFLFIDIKITLNLYFSRLINNFTKYM